MHEQSMSSSKTEAMIQDINREIPFYPEPDL